MEPTLPTLGGSVSMRELQEAERILANPWPGLLDLLVVVDVRTWPLRP